MTQDPQAKAHPQTQRRTNPETQPEHAGSKHYGTEHLIVVRESAMYDFELLDGMLHQTLSHCTTLPGVEDVQAAGLQGIRSDPSPFTRTELRRGKTRGDLVEHEGVLYLVSAGSAHSLDDAKLQNAFIELLIDTVETHRPRCVHVATISRLVRAAEHGGRLLGALKRHCEVVYTGGMPIVLNDPYGAVMWQTLAMIAAMERDLIVQRLTIGRVNRFRAGRWVFSKNSIPQPWYADDGFVKLDESKVEATKQMLVLLADASKTPARVVEELAACNTSSPQLQKLHGHASTLADAASPWAIVNRLLRTAELYETGRVTKTLANPFPGHKNVGGIAVDYTASAAGVIPLSYSFPLPKGGFAPPEIFDAIARRTAAQTLKGAASHKQRRPLLQFPPQVEGEHEYVLHGVGRRYGLRRIATRKAR